MKRLVGTVALLATLATVATSCNHYEGWLPLDGGRQRCAAPVVYRVNPNGFTSQKATEIKQVFAFLGYLAGIEFVDGGDTALTWEQLPTAYRNIWILVEHRDVVDGNGQHRYAWSNPRGPNGDGYYTGGLVWFDPTSDAIPSGHPLAEAGFWWQALVFHELGHHVGLADLYGDGPWQAIYGLDHDPNNVMGYIPVAGWGPGDAAGYRALGCPDAAA